MKRRKRPESSVMFLLELMIAIFFFTIASAICVQIFVKAHLLTKNSVDLQKGVNACASAAELVAAADSYDEALSMLQTAWPEGTTDPDKTGTFYINYEEDTYTQTIRLTQEDGMLTCEQTFITNEDQNTVYTLSTVNYLERKRQ